MFSDNFQIGNRLIGENSSTYFIADIAANHDGSLSRAKDLIFRAADAGADAAKFQHFSAKTIVSDKGFRDLGKQQSHQREWKKSVFEVYEEASLKVEWTAELAETCKDAEIDFFSSPYSFELADQIDPFVPAYKIGSGDITWIEMVKHIAEKGKPYIMASGASNMSNVLEAVEAGVGINPQICLMQCNTNYTASLENFRYINLNVLKLYRKVFPELVLGLSDHTPGHSTVLGAIALGAKMIEKHFTDDCVREGPDHKFSMDPSSWSEMVNRSRELELALGDGIKRVEDNERETFVLQRRAIRTTKNIAAGEELSLNNTTLLRPCPVGAIEPQSLNKILGKKVKSAIEQGEHLTWTNIEL